MEVAKIKYLKNCSSGKEPSKSLDKKPSQDLPRVVGIEACEYYDDCESTEFIREKIIENIKVILNDMGKEFNQEQVAEVIQKDYNMPNLLRITYTL
jgi:hypothetical protein